MHMKMWKLTDPLAKRCSFVKGCKGTSLLDVWCPIRADMPRDDYSSRHNFLGQFALFFLETNCKNTAVELVPVVWPN